MGASMVTMTVCYLLCLLPYSTVALLATFGRPGLVTPEVSIVPSVLAKNNSHRPHPLHIHKQAEGGSSNNKYSTKATKTLKTLNKCDRPPLMAVAGHCAAYTSDSKQAKGCLQPRGSTTGVVPGPEKPAVGLTAYSNSLAHRADCCAVRPLVKTDLILMNLETNQIGGQES